MLFSSRSCCFAYVQICKPWKYTCAYGLCIELLPSGCKLEIWMLVYVGIKQTISWKGGEDTCVFFFPVLLLKSCDNPEVLSPMGQSSMLEVEQLSCYATSLYTLPSFKSWISLGFATSCYVIVGLSMVQAMETFLIT